MCEHMTENPDLVPPQDACPVCGERHIDSLVWIDDEWVRCASCGIQYDPQTGGRRAPA
jgi:rubredoxin